MICKDLFSDATGNVNLCEIPMTSNCTHGNICATTTTGSTGTTGTTGTISKCNVDSNPCNLGLVFIYLCNNF